MFNCLFHYLHLKQLHIFAVKLTLIKNIHYTLSCHAYQYVLKPKITFTLSITVNVELFPSVT